MGKIEIVKKSITKLNVDVIVNAANSGLQAGGGVCGAIFNEAGYAKLQKACNKIGHCPTGSAVITPGFDLKADYIIHAVGPIWDDGKHGEPEQLYSAYYKSLELAAENGCKSIGFPLISAGIFGYPKEEAWEVAVRACCDYFRNNSYVELNVVFAILDDKIITIGKSVLDKFSENGDNKKTDLQEKEEHRNADVQRDGTIIGFHLSEEPFGCFSNWYNAPFVYAGVTYTCVEQYMMSQKVSL